MAAEPQVFALVFAVLEPGVVFVAAARALEPEVAFVADVAEPQASVDIPLAFDVVIPVSGLAAGVDSSGRPRFVAFPNTDYSASPSSSVEVADNQAG